MHHLAIIVLFWIKPAIPGCKYYYSVISKKKKKKKENEKENT